MPGTPDEPEFFACLHARDAPLRVDDLAAHVSALDVVPRPLLLRSWLGVPMRHRGGVVGGVYPAEKVGGAAFSDEDEETLGLCAAQARSRLVSGAHAVVGASTPTSSGCAS